MIKTFNINLAGQIFNVNEDAYEQLSGYFNSLRAFYKEEEEKDEIIRDIEARFAELFLAKGKNYIITKEDAAEVINMMGNPQEFDEEKNHQSESTAATGTSQTTYTTGKRLYRDPDNSVVAGVCAGIANYFGISDPVWVRIAFILLTIITGFGFGMLFYPILWFIMPEAITAAQKLEMRGEAVNLGNIEKQVKDLPGSGKPKGVLNQMIAFLGAGVLIFFKFLLWVGIAFGVLIGGVLIISLFVLLIALAIAALFGIPFVNNFFFVNASDGWFLGIGGLLVGVIPIIFGIVALVHILSKKVKPLKRNVVFPLIGLFLFGCLLLNLSGYHAKQLIAEKKRVNQTYPLNYNYKSDTLQLTINPAIKDEDYDNNNIRIDGLDDLMDFISNHKERFYPVEIEILPSSTDSFTVVKEYSASGKTDKEAIDNATAFTHEINQINNKLIIDPYIQFDGAKVKFRNQKLKIKVFVPEGKVIRWDERTERYMDEHKLAINWDNVKHKAERNRRIVIKMHTPPAPPAPPVPANITINIDPNKDPNDAIDKAQEKLDQAREKIEAAKEKMDAAQEEMNDRQMEIQDSLEEMLDDPLHREHYIFRMVNGELIAID